MEALFHLGVPHLRGWGVPIMVIQDAQGLRVADKCRATWRPGSNWACCTCAAGRARYIGFV